LRGPVEGCLGVGLVPPRPFPRGGPGDDLPGRLHREARGLRTGDLNRPELGRLGESLACWFLTTHGVRVLATNVRVGRGEIDILARDGGTRVAVEVRTTRGRDDPVDAADPAKRERASGLAHRIGARRFDVIGFGFDPAGFDVHWVPGSP